MKSKTTYFFLLIALSSALFFSCASGETDKKTQVNQSEDINLHGHKTTDTTSVPDSLSH